MSPGPAAEAMLADWLGWLAATGRVRAATRAVYARDAAVYLDFLAGHLGGPVSRAALAGLTVTDLRAWMAREHGRGLSARSLARSVSGVRAFHGWLAATQGIECPAVDALRPTKIPPRLPRPVAEADARAVIAAVGQQHPERWIAARDAAALTLIWGAGLRISEALGLKQRDAPLAEAVTVTGKGGRQRMVPVLPVSRAAVESYRDLCPHVAGPDEALFLGARGGPLNPRLLSGAMATARMALGLPPSATPHALRHAFATQLLAAGGDLRAVQELLGHASLGSTQIYTAIDETQLMATYRRAHPGFRE